MLTDYTKPSQFSRKEKDKVRCLSCGLNCLIAEGQAGVCGVNVNKKGELYTPYNYVSSLVVDPVEKKPLYHFYPGEEVLSFGMLGCNFNCFFCQNWEIAHLCKTKEMEQYIRKIFIHEIIQTLSEQNIRQLSSTYNEPLITSTWSFDIFRQAKKMGVKTSFVTNGLASKEILEVIKQERLVDAFNVDLKSFSQKNYSQLGGQLQIVLDTIKFLKENNFWVEITTLLIPGWNDQEIQDIAKWLASVDKEIPWHVSAYSPCYKSDYPATQVSDLQKAIKYGEQAGLKHIYAGNIRGALAKYENTYCAKCGTLLIERYGYQINKKISGNKCPKCGKKVAGVY